MTTFESDRAGMEARAAVSRDRAPSADHETALQKYLTTSSYLSTSAVTHQPRPLPRQTAPHDSAGAERAAVDKPTGEQHLVVVGVDGSACSRHAAQWAAAEAERRGTGLRLIHAYVLPPAGSSGYNPYPPNLLGEMREEGLCLLADTAAELHRHHPSVAMTTQMLYGDPGRVLARESAAAAITVVGAHGRSRIAMALGSVAAHLANTNPAPVAVIRTRRPASDGPVVLGVDATTGDEALDFAFAEAELRGTELIALHCWTDRRVDPLAQEQYAVDLGRRPAAELHAEWLIERLAARQSEHPRLTVRPISTDQRATVALLEQAESAQLLVLGHRGHHGFAGMVLGSTGQAMITRCETPIVVVPPVGAN